MSTFSIDVDTASYAFLRAALNEGWLPQSTDAVRTEELVNYFPYDYAPPETRDTPFATHVSVMPAPWNDAARLMHIGIKGYALDRAETPPANLVFLVDTSGSMDAPDKLPLLVRSLKLLLTGLAPEDRVAIVAYAGAAGVVLEPTPVSERGAIVASLERLGAGGSTAGAEGIREAYRLAARHFVEGGGEPRHPRHRRGLQRRHLRPRCARELHRAQARERGLALGARLRDGQLQRRADAAPRPARQRQRRLHRFALRGAQGAAGASVLDARDHREGREDPGRVQPRAR